MNRIFQESRTETIMRHTEAMFLALRMTPAAWSVDLVAEYHRLVPAAARTVRFQAEGSTANVLANNGQMVNRLRSLYEDNAIRFPADLQEAWVNCLREPYRNACRLDLAMRDGTLYVAIPDLVGCSDLESVSRVTMAYAGVLHSVAPTMEDFVIDQKDRPLIPPVVRSLDIMLGEVTSLRERYMRQLLSIEGSSQVPNA